MPRLIQADVLDSRKSDWSISDDGADRGSTRKIWPAPVLRPDDRTPALPSKSKLTRSGLPDAYAFLRPSTERTPLDFEDFEDAYGGPPLPTADAMGLPQYRTVPRIVPGFTADVPGNDRYEAGMLHRFLSRTDAGALDSFSAGYHSCGEACGFIDAAFLASEAGNIYDDIGSTYHSILGLFKKWGARLSAGQQKEILDAVHNAQAHATDSQKWPAFENMKARILRIRKETLGPNAAQDAELERDHFRWLGGRYPGGGLMSTLGKGLASVGKGIGSVGEGAFSIAKGIATPVAALVTSPVKLASDIASGKNVFQSLKDTVQRDLASAKSLAPYVQAALSVTGIGAGINAAIAAGSALAQGQPITSAIVNGMKGAFGPAASSAFDAAYNIARGQNVSEAALQAVIDNAPGGEIGKKAAATAVAVAKGQNLQQAAVGLVKSASETIGVPKEAVAIASDLVSGKNIVDTAKSAVGSQAMVAFSKLSPFAVGVMNNTGPRIENTVKGALPSILSVDARMVAQTLLSRPELRGLPIEKLAQKLNTSTSSARDGMGAVLQAVQKSGGPEVPSLSAAQRLASRIPMGMNFDNALARFGSRAAPKSYSHNAGTNATAQAARLRQMGSVFHALGARGLDAGALDPKNMPTIRQGSTDASSGGAVSQWQKILNVAADGKFGPQTAAATIAMQKKNGLTADGIVGPKTWAAGLVGVVVSTPVPGSPPSIPGLPPLPPPTGTAPIIAATMPTIRQGSTGAEVKTWQIFLQIPADGIFGPQTTAATKSFQAKNALVADGIVGPKTWEKAMSGTSAPTTPTGTPPPPTLPPPGFPGTGLPPVITTPPISIPTPGGGPPIVIPPQTIPIPPIISGGGGTPPFFPPTMPPTTTPPSLPPVVTPPTTTPPTGGGASKSSAMIPVVVGLGLLAFLGLGSSTKIFKV